MIQHDTPRLRIALDVMGADGGVETVIEGIARARTRGLEADLSLFGQEGPIRTAIAAREVGRPPKLHHRDDVVSMTDKPSSVVRRGRGTSMWGAVEAVKEGQADVALSSGNTGALMAMAMLQLRMIEGIDRPAIAALWPTQTHNAAVLDVGANVEASARQLVQFAIMGEAYFRALTGKAQPSVGLLNVGAEDVKGHAMIKEAAATLREAANRMNFIGFVEGDDISTGDVDVVITDGFTGNIALKTAEGTARMIGGWMKTALGGSLRSKLASALMMPALKALKEEMNPSRVNGGIFLGVGGLIVKSHGGADADGVASALRLAERLAKHPLTDEIARTVRDVEARSSEHEPAGETDVSTADGNGVAAPQALK